MTFRPAALALGLVLVLTFALAGCTLPNAGAGGAGNTPGESPETSSEGEGTASSPIDEAVADGMPNLPLVGCETVVDYTSEHNDTSAKWVFIYSCADTSAYDETVSGLEKVEASDHNVDLSNGSDGYLLDQDMFYIQLAGQDELEVSTAITGFEGDYEAKYTVVFREN
jgi:hypothetical protein